MTDSSTAASAADTAALALAAAAGSGDFAAAVAKKRAARRLLATLLAHELGASHRLMMRLAARADGLLDRAEAADEDGRLGLEAVRTVGGAARMMERYRLGLLALDRLRGDKGVEGIDRVVSLRWGGDDPPNDPPPSDPSPSAPPPSEPPPAVPAGPPHPKGFGQLRYG